jgi:hypothetical protein
MAKAKSTRIRVLLDFLKAQDTVVLSRGYAILKGVFDNNSVFNKSPVDAATLKAALDGFSVAINDAQDGGRKAIAERNRLREVVVRILRQIGHYVEGACGDDLTTFLSSGYETVTATKAGPQPLPVPMIKKIDQGKSGELLVSFPRVAKAYSYQLRYAPMPVGGADPSWKYQAVPTAGTAPFEGLTPGTIYVFQIAALGRLGLTDWSNSVTKMCT